MKRSFVYIMSNQSDTVVYIGVTADLERRVYEHKNGMGSVFTSKYHCVKLVYYEEFNDIRYAISREKQLKNWKREWKNELIKSVNPTLKDIAADW